MQENQTLVNPYGKEIQSFKVNNEVPTPTETRSSSRASTLRKPREERPPIVFGGGSRFNFPDTVLKKLEKI